MVALLTGKPLGATVYSANILLPYQQLLDLLYEMHGIIEKIDLETRGCRT